MKQLKFKIPNAKSEFGGQRLVGRRKSRRPLCSKRGVHLVIKANQLKERFPGVDLRRAQNQISRLVTRHARKSQAKLYAQSVNFNHLHLAMRFHDRSSYNKFIRGLNGHLVLELSDFFGVDLAGLWDHRPFTRVVEWGRAFRRLLNYITINEWEAAGWFLRPVRIVPDGGK